MPAARARSRSIIGPRASASTASSAKPTSTDWMPACNGCALARSARARVEAGGVVRERELGMSEPTLVKPIYFIEIASAPGTPPGCARQGERPMKLATYKDGSRDGQLVVVSRDLATAHYATGIATRMQQVLDDWNFLAPQLQDLYETLNQGKARHAFPFEPRQCMAPLPRAYQWADGSAYINHVELVRRARNAEVPESFY